MKDLYPGYYPYNKTQRKAFIKDATIVFGASVLLDLYRISHGKQLLDLVEKKVPKDKLWLPYDTVWLYHNRLFSVIDEQIEDDNNASMHLTSFKESINNRYGHPYIPQDQMVRFNSFIEELEKSIETDRNFLLSFLEQNELKTRISNLFHSCIGDEYDATQMRQVFDESQERNRLQIPPCLTFSSSKDPRIINNRYVIWKQIQNYAKENHKSVLMVLNRITPNWFFIYKDRVVTPHQSLINEFKQITGQNIYIMSIYDYVKDLLDSKDLNNPEVKKILAQLHDKPTHGHSQQICPMSKKTNSI